MKLPVQIIIFFVILLLFSCQDSKPSSNQPIAVKGVLDLRNSNEFKGDTVINLEGEWEFYWEELIQPSEHSFKELRQPKPLSQLKAPNYIQVPSQWQRSGYPVDGYATYRLVILLPQNSREVESRSTDPNYSNLNATPSLSIAMTDAETAYEMYINGKLAAVNGKVGKSKEKSEPYIQYKTFSIDPFLNNAVSLSISTIANNFSNEASSSHKVIEILIHISNYHFPKAGLWGKIKFGSTYEIEKEAKQKFVIDLIVFSALFIMGLYHLGLFLNRKKESSTLYFGLFCFLVAFRTVGTGERMIFSAFPFLPFQFVHKLEFISFYFGTLVFLRFVKSLFKDEVSKSWLNAFSIILIPCTLLVLILPFEYYVKSLILVQTTALIAIFYVFKVVGTAILRKKKGAGLFLLGFLFFAFCIINDILKGVGLVFFPELTSYGLLTFVFFQSIALSRSFASGFQEAEKLSSDLEDKSARLEEISLELFQLTQNLELKIEERTKNLEEAKQEIEELNNFTQIANSQTDLNAIFITISKFIFIRFNILVTWLFLPDEKKEFLYSYKVYSYKKFSDDAYNYIMTKKVPLEKSKGGTLSRTFTKKKPFYLNRITKFNSVVDTEIVEVLSLKTFLQVPLIRKGECVGILCFSNLELEMNLSKSEIQKLSNLCSQIAGAIDTNHLLQQVESARKGIENAKKETEVLNSLIKNLNEDLNIKVIMQKVHAYINVNYNINYYGLAVVDKSKEYVVTVDTLSPDFISREDQERISSFSTRVKDVVGAHALAFKSKKPFYAPRIRKSGMTEEELFNQETTRLESILIIPLILQNEPIGFLDLYNAGKMELSKEDITKLSILGEQLAGIIYGSNLFQEVQEAKEKAIVAQEAAEKQKTETEELNKLIRSLNEELDMKVIMRKVVRYVSDIFKIKHHALYIATEDQKKVKLLDENFPEFVNESDRTIIRNFEISILGVGAHAVSFRAKRPFFPRKIRRNSITEEELYVIEKCKIESFLMIPLILQNEPIGILDFFNVGKMELSEGDITKLSILGEQLTGIIYGSNLFKQVQEEKEKANLAREEAELERSKSEKLLLNILPKDVARELKEKGFAEPELFENVSVMFTDFKGFTSIAEKLSPQELIKDLDACFVQFDKISERFNLEKLKTIGDSYMCAGGIPRRNTTHAIDCCLAALEIQSFMNLMKRLKEERGFPYWELRLGIHSGPLIAGVIGERKFAYDVWGDTVNIASRMESGGTSGKINISSNTYEIVKELFNCEYRGEISAKNKGLVKMYYLDRIKPEFSKDEDGLMPNGKFWETYG